ncbi:hypothetical protein MesoLj131b_06860 [Mesorhizobium sp. 131-2-5]|nr:hypothetical protein MesoLj131b_06860 [Mesorhizobium sp. 131-2-5]
MDADSLFKPPPDAVAHNSVADLLGDGVADARHPAIAAVEDLDEEKPSASLFTTTDGQEFRAFQKPLGILPHWLAGCGQRYRLA